MLWPWLALGGVLVIAVVGLLVRALPLLRRHWRETEARHAHTLFTRQREYLEARFFTAASRSGKPRGLRWTDCDWDSDFEFARDRQTGQLVALASVTIQFEAVEGSDMEGLPAVGNLRHASAVFYFDGRNWTTAGKAVFNLNPTEAIVYHHSRYERVVVA